MGNLVQWPSWPTDADWTSVIIKRASSSGGTYSTIATINAKDSDGYWVVQYWDESGGTNHFYKIAPYNSVGPVTGPDSDALQSSTGPTMAYTTAAKVASFLQVRIGGDTRPAIWEVEEIIGRKQDEIDFRTSHAWRTRYSCSQSGSETAAPTYEYHSIRLDNMIDAGIPIYLNHRSVATFAALSGDVFEVWEGNSYTDYLANKTEGRNNDYWVDYANGTIYIRDVIKTTREQTVRLKYRYGEAAVPGDIEELCILMTALDILMMNDRTVLIPNSPETMSMDSKITRWQRRIDDIIAQRKEIVVLGSS